MRKEEVFKIHEVNRDNTKCYYVYVLLSNIFGGTNWVSYKDSDEFSSYEQAEEWLRKQVEGKSLKRTYDHKHLKWKSNN
jgi:hypothetical protein